MQSAIEIAKKAEERKAEIEQNRDIPADLIAQTRVQSLSRLWVAKEYDGLQKSVHEVMEIWQKMA